MQTFASRPDAKKKLTTESNLEGMVSGTERDPACMFDILVAILSRKVDIENSQAHRALADTLTTARVYLELKKRCSSEKEVMIDDLLADLDNW